MMMHIGDRQTLKTACGKPVKRRWWMERHVEEVRFMAFGGKQPFVATRKANIRPEDISCPACRRTL